MSIVSEIQETQNRFEMPFHRLDRAWQATWDQWEAIYELGFNLVPAAARTKLPPKGFTFMDLRDQRLSREAFEAYRLRFSAHGSCDMLIVTGNTPGIGCVVIDADDEEADRFVTERCPATPWTVRTRRGRHHYYRHPGNGYIPQFMKLRCEGREWSIDRKADGNVVVAPGSQHREGHIYQWEKPWTRELWEQVPVFDPAWLPNEVESKARTVEAQDWRDFDHDQACDECLVPIAEREYRARKFASEKDGTVEGEGVASNRALWLAGKIAIGYLLPYDTAVDVMFEEWAEKEDQEPPWKLRDIEHKVKSAIKNAHRYPGVPGDMLFQARTWDEDRLTDVLNSHVVTTSSVQCVDAFDDPADDEIGPEFEPAPLPEPDHAFGDEAQPKPVITDELLSLSGIRRKAESVERVWIVDGWLQAGHLSVISGREKRGKSTAAYDLMTALVSGGKWMNYIQCRRSPVLLLDYENPIDYVWSNLERMFRQRDVDLDEVDQWYGQVDPDLIRQAAAPLVADYALAKIAEMERRTDAKQGLMIIDTAAPAWMAMFEDSGWTNNNSQVRKALEIGQAIARSSNWHVMVIYHDNKSGTGAAGSYEWYGVPDVYLRYEREVDDPRGTLSIFGRLLDKPAPLEFTRQGWLLDAKVRGYEASQKAMYEENREYADFRDSLPEGRENAVNQSFLFEKFKGKHTKSQIAHWIQDAEKRGGVTVERGEKNAKLVWRRQSSLESI